MKSWIGIDPGLDGAVAYLSGDGTLRVWDMPLRVASVTRKKRKRKDKKTGEVIEKMVDATRMEIDGYVLADIIDEIKYEGAKIFVEKVQSMSKQGVTSMFNFGSSFGIIRGVLEGAGLEYTLVTPQKWKKALGVTSNKEVTGGRAIELFPGYDNLWFGKNGGLMDGRFEAALIAYYGSTQPST